MGILARKRTAKSLSLRASDFKIVVRVCDVRQLIGIVNHGLRPQLQRKPTRSE